MSSGVGVGSQPTSCEGLARLHAQGADNSEFMIASNRLEFVNREKRARVSQTVFRAGRS